MPRLPAVGLQSLSDNASIKFFLYFSCCQLNQRSSKSSGCLKNGGEGLFPQSPHTCWLTGRTSWIGFLFLLLGLAWLPPAHEKGKLASCFSSQVPYGLWQHTGRQVDFLFLLLGSSWFPSGSWEERIVVAYFSGCRVNWELLLTATVQHPRVCPAYHYGEESKIQNSFYVGVLFLHHY